MNERSAPLQPGDPSYVGDYEILGRLGAGGMGVVFLGRARSGRLVAVKVVHDAFAHDDEFRARFRSEVARARQVPPFCTAEVLDADPEARRPYLVVEYVDGPTLTAEVRQKGPLSPSNLHALAVGIATALTVIHEAGVIHRDLKPGNVLLAPGSPKVIDFGIARALESSAQHTRSGQVMGTINYMAPERFDEPAVALTPAADIFAWACVIAFAGTGHAPFEADTTMATLARILTQRPSLDGLDDGPLRDLVVRALSADPAHRPTARDLLSELLGGDRTAVLPPVPVAKARSKSSHRGRTAILASAVVVALAVAGGVGYHLVSGKGKAADAASPGWMGSSSEPSSAAPSPVVPGATKSKTPKPTATATTAPVGDGQPPVKAEDVTGVDPYGPYFIYNLATGMCVDLPGSGPGSAGQQVTQDVCQKTTDDNQLYVFVPDGYDAAGNELYLIRNAKDGLCLDVPGAGTVDAATGVTEFDCTEQDNQDFRLAPQFASGGRTYYRLINTVNTMCLDVDGVGDGPAGARIALFGCASGDDHEWGLVRKSGW